MFMELTELIFFQFIFGNLVPFLLGPMIVHAHLYTFLMWGLVRVSEAVDGHCGYEFPWSPFRIVPFSGSAEKHDFHHSVNMGNYSSFFCWWDVLMGTDQAYIKLKQTNNSDKQE
eukprot:TRINITY_DN8698_c0_g2_i3.p1 TRINITY_DN8698_c0_g2~~TRINITY_DN8698_c0_g2_i3.p1  ORF type:complete len:114 (-),score=24.53 TRINITY_DN8698_c0_g2_i3:59-400(-)